MTIRFTLAATAALALAACHGGNKPASEASTSSSAAPAASSAAPATPAAAASGVAPSMGAKPTRDFVVGKWGTDGDCKLALDLRADGTTDGPFGNWSYKDGVISFADTPDMRVEVTVLDEKTMASKNAQGTSHKMTRCP